MTALKTFVSEFVNSPITNYGNARAKAERLASIAESERMMLGDADGTADVGQALGRAARAAFDVPWMPGLDPAALRTLADETRDAGVALQEAVNVPRKMLPKQQWTELVDQARGQLKRMSDAAGEVSSRAKTLQETLAAPRG